MKFLIIFIVVAALYSEGDCYGYDYDDFGMLASAYQPDYHHQFEPEVRSMMMDEPDKRPKLSVKWLDIKSTPKPALRVKALHPTPPPKMTLRTFKPFTRRPKTSKPITARALKNAPKKTPPPIMLKKKPVEDEEEEEE
ncbi:unnamed protein product [Orchesella dallaii]|uniref:Uncharacterized protein n=1 Tax=Orchesella dallaii TaxID=48710 RepID=A0ABP1RAU8_9HEXA